jgi:hypothetical protein
MMNPRRTLLGIALIGLFSFSIAGAADKWLHVRVDEGGDNGKGERVSINIPLSVVARMLPLISIDELQHGKLHLDIGDDLEGIDLAALADALRDSPDADFVTVESDDEIVRIRKEGDFIIVHAEERGHGSNETVRVRMPLAVVDALVGDDPYELDLIAALDALSEYDGDPLVDIQSDDSSVRVWIDSSDSGR